MAVGANLSASCFVRQRSKIVIRCPMRLIGKKATRRVAFGALLMTCMAFQVLLVPANAMAGYLYLNSWDLAYDDPNSGKASASGDVPLDSGFFGAPRGIARAAAGSSFDGLLKAYATYTDNGNATAIAEHWDTAYYGGAGPPPEMIRLNFQVDGEFSAAYSDGSDFTPDSPFVGEQYIQITAGDGIQSWFFGSGPGGVGGLAFDSQTFGITERGNAKVGSLYATFHIDVLEGDLGVYAWHLALAAYDSSIGDPIPRYSATVDFFNTASLISVTLPDGTPITSDVTFASGLTFDTSPAPEPTSLCLAAMGMLSIGVCRRRRRN